MSILDPIYAHPRATRVISKVSDEYARVLGLKSQWKSIGLITADNDDALYVSIDEATKMADVRVIYAHSFYAGAKCASGINSGEIIALLAGPDPTEVKAGLEAAVQYLETKAIWYSADAQGGVAFFPHVISRIGYYLASVCNLPVGTPVAYLVAPPLEGSFALDAALKAAEVSIAAYTAPPSETNFMSAILTGAQSACEAAALAFQEAVLDVAQHPIMY